MNGWTQTIPVSRRQFLAGACCCATFTALRPEQALSAANSGGGCFLSPTGYEAFRSQSPKLFGLTDHIFSQAAHSPSTGNGELDRELNRALRIAANAFGVNPAFGFFDPDKFRDPGVNGMNAFAWHGDVDVPGTRGLVGFGAMLFRNELFGYDPTGTSVMCIVAHEFAHNLQWLRGYHDKIPRLQCELNADFLAGYYLGTRKAKMPTVRVEPAMDLFARLGRASDGDPNRTHGNSVERVAAAHSGLRLGYEQRASLDEAVKAGRELINYRPGTR